jgi:ferredoxin
MKRSIIRIDRERCDGCGLCVDACAEGAIQLVNGKAELVSETYCDGLGACVGECPQDALTVEAREAPEFDAAAVEGHLKDEGGAKSRSKMKSSCQDAPLPCGCPGSASQVFDRKAVSGGVPVEGTEIESQLAHWPIQLHLVPVDAPYFKDAKLLIAADCVPFACADFHRRFLAGKSLIIGCPKLDDTKLYREKLAEIFRRNNMKSVDILYMEVPCCFGLVRLVAQALEDARKTLPVNITRIGIRGNVCETDEV